MIPEQQPDPNTIAYPQPMQQDFGTGIQQLYQPMVRNEPKFQSVECLEAIQVQAEKTKDYILGNYKYPIEAIEVGTNNSRNVERRYGEIETLHKLFQLVYPGCIVPGIPPKLIGSGEEAMTRRHRGIQKFFESVRQHPVLNGSKLFELFLTHQAPFSFEVILPEVLEGQGSTFTREFILETTNLFEDGLDECEA